MGRRQGPEVRIDLRPGPPGAARRWSWTVTMTLRGTRCTQSRGTESKASSVGTSTETGTPCMDIFEMPGVAVDVSTLVSV